MNQIILNKIKELEGAGDYRNVSKDDGLLLNILIKAANFKNILEAGTSNGYSGMWLAEAVQQTQGQLKTIERIPEIQALAQKNFEEAGLDKCVTVLGGIPDEVIRNLNEQFDLIFIDDGDDYIDIFKTADSKLLKKNGIFAVHNATFPEGMLKPLLDVVYSNENYQKIIFNSEHGLLIALKTN